MTPERWRRVEDLYHAALTRGESERMAFLANACADDEALRLEVESLLAQPASADGFLDGRAVAMAAKMVSDTGASVLTGRRLGAYQVHERIGVGGMGEVYRARDTKLGRDVAIKILSRLFTSDPERLARFEREARVLASLNHPHIGAIYGLEDADGVRALVLELVDGETLADRIARGPIPVNDTLTIARQIADALDSAHEKGVIHRDLKPANIKITLDGIAKVLDFGLAKAASGDAATADLTQSPTVTVRGTREGVILGTAAYMSPEQARGQTVDKRTDIWAFGCVLYEMLTGRTAFARDTITDTLAAIVERELDWSALPAATPLGVRRLLRRCFEKDPKRRLRDIAEATFQLEDRDDPARPDVSPRSRPRELLAWSVAGVLFVAAGVGLSFLLGARGRPSAARTSRTVIALPTGQKLISADREFPLAVAPDGSRLAYVAEEEGRAQLYVRELGDLEPRAIPGTAGAHHPFFSPDGQSVAFFASGALQKVAVAGGAPLRICDVPAMSMGGSWGSNNTIVFASVGSDLMRVDVAGGTPQPLKGSSPASWPEILPGGTTVLFTTGVGGNFSAIATMPLGGGAKRIVARLANSPLEGQTAIGTGGNLLQARFVPSGHLVYGQSPGIVRAVPFDLMSLSITGSPASMVNSVERAMNGGGVYFAVSQTGLLLYASTGDRHQLVWVDRKGIATPISNDRAAFRLPRVSPDGKLIAVAVSDDTRRSDIWVYDAERGTKRRLTNENHNLEPVWTPDGTRLTVSTGSAIVELPASGSTARTVLSPRFGYPSSWSPDGQSLLYYADAAAGMDLWMLSRGEGGKSRPLLVRPGSDAFAQFSPNGRWVAYVSDESGHSEVYVGHFPDLGDKVAISTDGGTRPRWSRDGRELFYRQGDALMTVAVDGNRDFHAGKPRRLFAGNYSGESHEGAFDVSPDGRQFVMVKSDEASTLRQLTAVQNWFEELRQRAPASVK